MPISRAADCVSFRWVDSFISRVAENVIGPGEETWMDLRGNMSGKRDRGSRNQRQDLLHSRPRSTSAARRSLLESQLHVPAPVSVQAGELTSGSTWSACRNASSKLWSALEAATPKLAVMRSGSSVSPV